VVVYVPRSIQNGSESLALKALEDFDVGIEAVPIAVYLKVLFLLVAKSE
jgi:hypothetical protein